MWERMGEGHINYTVFIITGGDDGGKRVDGGEDRIADAATAEEPCAATHEAERGGEGDGAQRVGARQVESRRGGSGAAEEVE